MDIEKEIIAEAKRFFELVGDEVCPLFLPPDQIEILDEIMEDENWEDRLTPIERDFYDLWEEIYDMIDDFIRKYDRFVGE